jgi:hypothetical protein
MITHNHSLVILCPAEHKATVEAAGQALGHSGNEYTVPCSYNGQMPSTHFGLHAWATEEVANMWRYAEEIPGLTAEQIAWLRSVLIISAREDILGSEHFDLVCLENGLERIMLGDADG